MFLKPTQKFRHLQAVGLSPNALYYANDIFGKNRSGFLHVNIIFDSSAEGVWCYIAYDGYMVDNSYGYAYGGDRVFNLSGIIPAGSSFRICYTGLTPPTTFTVPSMLVLK